MKSAKILVVIVLAVFMAAFATTAFAVPLPNGTALSIDQGAGSGVNTPCSTGSCFSMLAGGYELWTDIGPGADGGIVIGTDQVSGGQEFYPAGADPGALSAAWFFFSNYGTFATAPFCATNAANAVTCVTTGSSLNIFDSASCANAASCLGNTTLGTWHVAWNGVAVPMGSALGCKSTGNAGNCLGVTSWMVNPSSSTQCLNSTYELHYTWVVPSNDPSGFGDVKFTLILRGAVTIPNGCYLCPAAPACKAPGLCNACTPGVCDYANLANGTLCNADTNKCTGSPNTSVNNDSCQNGVCVAGPLKNCDLGNPCKNYGTCVPSTGNCPLATNKPNGTPCNDNNACTTGDNCQTGVCVGTLKNCNDGDVCTIDSCDTLTGACSNIRVPYPCCCSCLNPLPANTKLLITPGSGSAVNTPCSAGSCFSMEQSPGNVRWTDFGPGTDGGFVVGKSQTSGGQETGPSGINNTPGQLTAAWNFFGSYGTFFTAPTPSLPYDGGSLNKFCGSPCQGADCITKTEVKVFNVAWNGNVFPVGSQLGCTYANCSLEQKNGIFVNDWQINPVDGGAWSMNYSQVVPSGAFTGVKFTAIMRGTVTNYSPPNCPPAPSCKSEGVLNIYTGLCVYANLPDGTACSDGNACTIGDTCQGGVCLPGIPVICVPGQTCDPATGICKGCTTNAQCNDNNFCTTDTCNTTNGTCIHTPIFCCNDPCSPYVCDPIHGCPLAPCLPACDDNNACTTDSCNAGACVHTPKNCNDNDPCTIDSCDTATGDCIHTPGSCPVCTNPLPAATKLLIAPGSGSALNVPCSVGSCFSMEQAPGYVTWTDFGPGTDGGFVVGKSQTSGGQETGLSSNNSTPGQLSSAWYFFANYGTFFTAPTATYPQDGGVLNKFCGTSCQGADCINKTELKVLNVAWNGNVVPMGSYSGCALSNCSDAQKNGIFVNDWQINPVTGGAWSMNYAQVVPSGAFTGVTFTAIMRGTVEMPVTDPCAGQPDGTSCNDGNACTKVDVCISGVCVGTVPVVCPPGPDQCHVAGTCDTATGVCSSQTKPNGTPCSDGNACTVGDSCQSGICMPGTPIACAPAPPCKVNIPCDTATGICSYANLPNGTPCPAEDICSVNGTCQNGICVQPPPIVCPPPPVCKAAGVCNPATGTCTYANLPNGTSCNDGNACTTNDVCTNGVCGGTAKVCLPPDVCHLPGTCDTATGACRYPETVAPTGCSDNNACTINDTCVAGVCVGTPVVCIPLDQCHVAGVCNILTGACSNPPAPNGTACNDNNACTINDACTNGVCSGTPKVCPAPDQCHMPGVCDPTTGVCSNPPAPNGTSCNDGKFCTLTDTCQNGACTGSGSPCTAGQTCDEVNHCVTINKCIGVVCNDGNTCHIGTCNTATGLCSYSNKPSGTACDDGNVCTSNDRCNSSGVCKGTNNTASCNDGNACTTNDRCSNGVCKGTAKNCNDGNACTTDSCDPASGACVYTAVVCNDGNECTTDSCDPKSGCKYTPKANGTACTDDGNFCTTDICQSGKCTHTAKDCNDHNICTADSCNPATGLCVHTLSKPTTITLIGDQPNPETSTQNLQIQTKFTVTNGGCVVTTSGNNKVYFSAGSSVDVNSKVGTGPDPTTIKLDGVSQSIAPASSTITCPSATTAHTIYLDNLKATGGKDKDNLYIYGNAQD